MDSQAPRQNAFRPLSDALSDTWLQVRAKPLIYVLIWLTLALAPYVILGFIFQKPLGDALGEYFDMFASWDLDTIAGNQELPPEYGPLTLRILGYYGIIIGISSLIGIYMGSVMAGTVSRFRDRSFPRFVEVLRDGAAQYTPFLLSVLYAVFRVFLRPVLVGGGGVILGTILSNGTISSFGFFVGFFLFLSDLNRYGLSPFIHLSLGSKAKESTQISKLFYQTHRPVISSLFLGLIMLPAIVLLLFYSLFLSSGFYFSGGVLIIWFLQSVALFAIVMTLINFARNTFIKTAGSNPQSGDVEGEAVIMDASTEIED